MQVVLTPASTVLGRRSSETLLDSIGLCRAMFSEPLAYSSALDPRGVHAGGVFVEEIWSLSLLSFR